MNQNAGIKIDCNLDENPAGGHAFCQITMRIGDRQVGNPEAWSLVGLMSGVIATMRGKLSRQELAPAEIARVLGALDKQALFDALYSLQWGAEDVSPAEIACLPPGADPEHFYALPMANECFDGECAYLLRAPGESSRLLWRDHGDQRVHEARTGFDDYLAHWRAAEERLAR